MNECRQIRVIVAMAVAGEAAQAQTALSCWFLGEFDASRPRILNRVRHRSWIPQMEDS